MGKLIFVINLGHAWFLETHTFGKLIFLIACFNIKQKVGHVWFLKLHTLGKLIFSITCVNIEQNLGHT